MPRESGSLLPNVSQFEVDFVVPRLGYDLPMGIDPFLLYKSRDPELSQLHGQIIELFNRGVDAVRRRDHREAHRLFKFPEPAEIGFGYTKKGKRGSGVGDFLTTLIIETLAGSPPLLERGIRHIEELQLLAVGINRDRVSDIAANILKQFLIHYTQKQCALWHLPITSAVPVENILDLSDATWFDGNFDLPVHPADGSPILLVPRRIVRVFPWINYDDFLRSEFAPFHRSTSTRRRAPYSDEEAGDEEKTVVAAHNRRDLENLVRYVHQKEAKVADAQPTLNYLVTDDICPQAETLRKRFGDMPSGAADATNYQVLILETMNCLFSPELIDGEVEVRTIDGTERRDIIFTNDSDLPFWSYIRSEHSGLMLMIETKNTTAVETAHINQTAAYLGDRIGRFAIIATRSQPSDAMRRKLMAVYNDSNPRKIILTLSDADFATMLSMKCARGDPTRYMQRQYRIFRQTVQ